jgi:hypothetical protein
LTTVKSTPNGARKALTSQARCTALPDKENFDPLTGERMRSRSAKEKRGKETKKVKATSRQTGVLRAKTVSSCCICSGVNALFAASEANLGDDICASCQGRSVVTAPVSIADEFAMSLEDADPFSCLSIITELDQIKIDARCYELTVSPLADISPAYATPVDSIAGSSDRKSATSKVSGNKSKVHARTC